MNPTFYDVLGVSPAATQDEIKTAWHDSAGRFEPGSGGSSAQFRLFNEAAEVLLDPERRKAYDEQLAAQRDTEKSEQAAPLPVTPEDTTVGADAGSPGRSFPVWALFVLGLMTAITMAAAIFLYTGYQRESAYEDALDEAPSAAEPAAEAILSYDYQSLDSDRAAATRFLTPGYSVDYGKTFDSLVRENATKTRAKVEATVLASSSMLQSGDESPDRIPVLLFVNQTTLSTANSGEPTVALNRVRFDMVNVDGTWLVDGITSY